MNKITLLTESTATVEVEIPVPCFLVSKTGTEHVALLDDNTIVSVFKSEGLTIIKNSALSSYSKKELVQAWKTFHSCTELHFFEAFDAAVESISLHPKLAV